jgi:hypothetical protein
VIALLPLLFDQVARRIPDMQTQDLENFLHPPGEDGAPNELKTAEECFQLVINEFNERGEDFRDEEELATETEEAQLLQTTKPSEGIEHIRQLIDLGRENSAFESGDILALNKLMERLQINMVKSMTQGTVDTYFQPMG